jgi:hypothetical protein
VSLLLCNTKSYALDKGFSFKSSSSAKAEGSATTTGNTSEEPAPTSTSSSNEMGKMMGLGVGLFQGNSSVYSAVLIPIIAMPDMLRLEPFFSIGKSRYQKFEYLVGLGAYYLMKRENNIGMYPGLRYRYTFGNITNRNVPYNRDYQTLEAVFGIDYLIGSEFTVGMELVVPFNIWPDNDVHLGGALVCRYLMF